MNSSIRENRSRICFFRDGDGVNDGTFEDGSQVEVVMFGYEAMIGVSALMGTKRSLNRIYTQIAGSGYFCQIELAKKEFGLGGDFQFLALSYVQAQLLQAMQSAGCNAKHGFEQRLARSLFLCADRAHSNTFRISQEFLADMLGSTRSTVSVAASIFQRAGLIQYSTGVIQIKDVRTLEKHACECYRLIKDHLDSYTEFDSAIVA